MMVGRRSFPFGKVTFQGRAIKLQVGILCICMYIWMFPKIVGFPPKSSIKEQGFPSETIHFGVSLIFGNTHIINNAILVGGLNPSEKYAQVKLDHFPQVGVKI